MTQEQKKKTLGLAVASLVFGCFFLFPFLGVIFSLVAIILGIAALVIIKNNKDTIGGGGLAISGIILGTVGIIIIPILAIGLAILIPGFVRGHLRANESSAQVALKNISAAYESFYASEGAYPASLEDLLNVDMPYIDEDYTSGSYRGYSISCRTIGSEGYTCSAIPVNCGISGRKVFVIDDTGTLYDEECD